MTFQFKPAVERGGVLYELPRPISSLTLDETWDSERFKVLLVDGDTMTGTSRNGVDITLAGELSSRAGSLNRNEADMFAVLEELRSRLHVGGESEKYRFYLYHDAASETYRYLESCTTVRLETDLSQAAAFTYRVVIHAEDPVIYRGVEG